MRREERVTVQGPVKEQQPDGMSHRGDWGGGGGCRLSARAPCQLVAGKGCRSPCLHHTVPDQNTAKGVTSPHPGEGWSSRPHADSRGCYPRVPLFARQPHPARAPHTLACPPPPPPPGEMWHSKIVPRFAVVFKDRTHVVAFTRSLHSFSPLQGSEGLNCWGHHVFNSNPVSQVSCRESRWLSCRTTATIRWDFPVRFLHCLSFGKFVPHFSMVLKILNQIFLSPNFAVPKYARTTPPPPPR